MSSDLVNALKDLSSSLQAKGATTAPARKSPRAKSPAKTNYAAMLYEQKKTPQKRKYEEHDASVDSEMAQRLDAAQKKVGDTSAATSLLAPGAYAAKFGHRAAKSPKKAPDFEKMHQKMFDALPSIADKAKATESAASKRPEAKEEPVVPKAKPAVAPKKEPAPKPVVDENLDAARRSPRIAKAKPAAAAVPGYMKPTALSQVRQGNVVGFNFTAPAKAVVASDLEFSKTANTQRMTRSTKTAVAAAKDKPFVFKAAKHDPKKGAPPRLGKIDQEFKPYTGALKPFVDTSTVSNRSFGKPAAKAQRQPKTFDLKRSLALGAAQKKIAAIQAKAAENSTVNTVLNENMQNIMANAREENMESTANSIHAVIRKANYLASAKERQAEKRNQARFGI